jgi:GNAT superfamily N-acetyltransferase
MRRTLALAAIAVVAAADETVLLGRQSRTGPEDVANWCTRVDFEHDSWLFEEDGELVACGWLNVWDSLGVFAGIVAQGWKGRGLGAAIADRAEERAAARGASRMHGFALLEDTAAQSLFAGRGYAEVRRFYEMAIELAAAPTVPALPDGLVLEPVRAEDFRAFYEALDEAFRDHWEWHPTPYEEWLEMRKGQHEDEDGPLWFLIRDGDEIAAVVRNEPNRSGGGYVGALGVRRPWRGRGLAKALLLHTFSDFHRRGKTRVALGVDAESPTGATHLYERVGMKVDECLVVYEKGLR